MNNDHDPDIFEFLESLDSEEWNDFWNEQFKEEGDV